MSAEPVTDAELFTLFEAARWAPSAGNSQPWHLFYAHRDSAHWPGFLDLLVEANRVWCVNAAVLVVLTSRTVREGTGRPLPTHAYDTGAAWASLALQGSLSGLVVHGMAGFDYARAHRFLRLPDEIEVNAMAAIGRPGRLDDLPESLRARETPSLRKPVSEFVHAGPWPDAPHV